VRHSTGLKAQLYVQDSTAKHRPAPTQINCYVNHKLMVYSGPDHYCWSLKKGCSECRMHVSDGVWRVSLSWQPNPASNSLTPPPQHERGKKIGWESSWFKIKTGRLL